MACKTVTVTIFGTTHLRPDWSFDFDGEAFAASWNALVKEMKRLGITLRRVDNRDAVIAVNSYADLLNAVKISSPADGHSNQCIGHIIGKSEHLDIMEDLKAAISRLAFAPETIAPSSEFRRVCHNCGCGC